MVAPGPGGGCESPTAGDTSSGDNPLWPPLLETSQCGLGYFSMATNSGEASVWPTSGRTQCGHLGTLQQPVATSRDTSLWLQLWGHHTVATSLRDMAQWVPSPCPPALGTSQYRCYMQGPLTRPTSSRDVTSSRIISKDMPPCPSPHLTCFSTLCPPKHWDLGVTWSSGGSHYHHRFLGGEHHPHLPAWGAAGIPRVTQVAQHQPCPHCPQEVPPSTVALGDIPELLPQFT